jgi:serine/threonine-protein kinase
LKTCPECCKEYEDGVQHCPSDTHVLKSSHNDPLIGSRLANRYEIVSMIGKGGMGIVYKARHEVMDRSMAIKMLHSSMVAAPEAVKRFFQEAQTISQVKHHHIVTLYDFGMSPQAQPFIVMDYLQGKNLKQLVKEEGALSFERGEHILGQVIEALSAAHAKNVIHLDLKPENIVLTEQNNDRDWVTLVDFGLSKLEAPRAGESVSTSKGGHIAGSPPYMSPEQCKPAADVDARSDIYSLAVVVYEMLSNRLPFEAKSSIEMVDCHRFGTPMPFHLSQPELKLCTELTHVFNRAFEKEPDRRQQTVEEFGEEVHDAMLRDGVKLRTMKHRAEVGSLDGFFSKESVAQCSSSSNTKTTSVQEQSVAASLQQVDNAKMNSGYQLADEAAGNAQPTLADGDSRLSGCPFCNSAIEPNLKFCLTCERQIVSPEEIYKLRGIGGTDGVPRLRTVNRNHGKFSNRTKLASANAKRLFKIQQTLRALLLLVVAYAGFVFMQQTNTLAALNRWVSGFLSHPKV